MKMKRFLPLLLLALSLTAWAGSKDQEARKVLDTMAQRLASSGGLKIEFTATQFVGKNTQGSTNGTMNILGRKFQMTTPEMLTWFDGKTQWSLQPGDTEVSLTQPTETELQALNPYAFLDLYKKGFNYKMKRGTLSNGKEGYRLFLTADNSKQDIREIYLEVDLTHTPLRVSLRQGKNQWVRIVVTSLQTNRPFKDSDFTFPTKDYPQAQIIDLR